MTCIKNFTQTLMATSKTTQLSSVLLFLWEKNKQMRKTSRHFPVQFPDAETWYGWQLTFNTMLLKSALNPKWTLVPGLFTENPNTFSHSRKGRRVAPLPPAIVSTHNHLCLFFLLLLLSLASVFACTARLYHLLVFHFIIYSFQRCTML